MIEKIIIMVLWATTSLLAAIEIAPRAADLDSASKFIVCLITIIGGPFFAIANVLEALLDCILPEGWDDDDDFKRY